MQQKILTFFEKAKQITNGKIISYLLNLSSIAVKFVCSDWLQMRCARGQCCAALCLFGRAANCATNLSKKAPDIPTVKSVPER